MARRLFERNYTALAHELQTAASAEAEFAGKLSVVVKSAYRLFDEQPDLFGFLLLSQHDHLDAMGEVEASPVDVVRDLIAVAMEAGEVPEGDPEEASALVLGLALQPVVFTVYGRLDGPVSPRAEQVVRAALAVLGRGPVA